MMNQLPPAPKRPRSNSPTIHPDDGGGYSLMPTLPTTQEDVHNIMGGMGSMEMMKPKMEYDDFQMINSFPTLDDFGAYSGDPYMYSASTLSDQPISTIAEQTPPLAQIGNFAPQIPYAASEKLPMSAALNPQNPHHMGPSHQMGYLNPAMSQYHGYLHHGMHPTHPVSGMGLPLQNVPMVHMPNIHPNLSLPHSQIEQDIKPQINLTKQRENIQNPGTPVVCSPDSSSNPVSQKALCTSSTTPATPSSQPNQSNLDSQLNLTQSGVNNLQNQLSNSLQQVNQSSDSSEIASIPPAPPQAGVDTEDNRHRLLQQQLGILLHAHRCLKMGPSVECKVPMCSTMKNVLQHMTVCETKENCIFTHCSSSRRIILHYKQCVDANCKLCKPLKSASNSRPLMCSTANPGAPPPNISAQDPLAFSAISPFNSVSKDPGINNAARFLLSSASVLPTTSALTTSTPVDTNAGMAVQAWHQEVKQDLRQHLVKKLVMAIYPSANMQDPGSVKNNRMSVLFTQAKRMEVMMFQQASSREEYYQMLAEKIYNIQKEIDTRVKHRRLHNKPMAEFIDPMSGLGGQFGGPSYGPLMQGSPYLSGVPQPPMPGPLGYRHATIPGQLMPRSDSGLPPPLIGDMMAPIPPMNRHINMPAEYMPMPQLHSWTPCPGNQDPLDGGGYPYRGMMPTHDVDDFNKIGNAPVSNPIGQSFGGTQINTVLPDLNGFNIIPPNKTITSKEAPNYHSMSNQPTSNLSSNNPSSTQVPAMNPASVGGPSTPGNIRNSAQQEPASSTTLPQTSDSLSVKDAAIQNEAVTIVDDFKQENISDNQISSLHPDFERTDINLNKLPLHLTHQNDAHLSDMETENIVTTASATTTTTSLPENLTKSQDRSQSDGHGDQVTPIKSEADLVECKPSSLRQDSTLSLMSVSISDAYVKQEPMSIDNIHPNKGKEGSGTTSDSISIPHTMSSSRKLLAPIRGARPKKVYPQEQLVFLLKPVVTALWNCGPDADAFKEPVDPETLGIPEYFNIVKYPMDLTTINKRLVSGEYLCPWEFINDIWLMFNNAWLFNRRNTKVYKSCTKLSEVYEHEISPVIKELGLCCGKKHDYSPQVLYCSSKNLCPINRDDLYWNYKDRFYYCQRCFSELEEEIVRFPDDTSTCAKKEEFKQCKNDYLDAESFIDCKSCSRRFHQVCVLYLSPLFPNGFTCQNCLEDKSDISNEVRVNYTARELPHYFISRFIEERVNILLREKECKEEVFIRLVSTGEKTMELKHKMRNRYPDHQNKFNYHTKALFAFEMIDNVEVCFYGMHLQEYGDNCPEPNTRRVYISYLDSVFFFRPKHLRTDVYHEILISYLEYCRNQGYLYAHIWACPPSEGDDYIFHCHPTEQKTPKPKRLQEWYKAMLDKAIEKKAITNYQDIYNYYQENESNPTAMPYFEGDFWPNIMEDFIKEIDHEEQERKHDEGRGSKKGGRGTKNKKNPTTRKIKGKSAPINGGDELAQKISYCAEKHKESFFVIEIQTECDPDSIKDPDGTVQCDLMEGRDPFLTLARERHLEFSSLRRAKYSTLALAYELHCQGHDKFIYTCNDCSRHVESRYHCNTCEDYDLCDECFKTNSHEHALELWRGEGEEEGNREANQQQSPEQILQRRIQTLQHALQCKNQELCRTRNCAYMKRIMLHAQRHQQFKSNTCTYCFQFFSLILKHAKICEHTKCQVPFCERLKMKLSEQKHSKRRKDHIMYLRRTRNMNSPVIQPTSPKSVPANPDVAPMEEATIPNVPQLNPASVKSAKSPASFPPSSMNESQIEHRKMTTQGPPPAGVETEQQAKLLVAEAISSGYQDPSLYNEASPVPVLQGQQQTAYRNMNDSPMSIARPSPMDPGLMYNSPVNPGWDNNIGISTRSPMHHGQLQNKGSGVLLPQVRNILNQLSSPHIEMKNRAMDQAKADPELFATIISMTKPYPQQRISGYPPSAPTVDSRNPNYGMQSMQPYISSNPGMGMQGMMGRNMRLPPQGPIPTQGGPSHQMNMMSNQMPLGMQRPINRMPVSNPRNLSMGSNSMNSPIGMGPRPQMNSNFMARNPPSLTRSTSMPGMMHNQHFSPPSNVQMQLQMTDNYMNTGYGSGMLMGVDEMLIHPSGTHGMPPHDQDRFYQMPPSGGNNIL